MVGRWGQLRRTDEKGYPRDSFPPFFSARITVNKLTFQRSQSIEIIQRRRPFTSISNGDLMVLEISLRPRGSDNVTSRTYFPRALRATLHMAASAFPFGLNTAAPGPSSFFQVYKLLPLAGSVATTLRLVVLLGSLICEGEAVTESMCLKVLDASPTKSILMLLE